MRSLLLPLVALACLGCSQTLTLSESHLFLDRRMPGITRSDVTVPLPGGSALRGWHLKEAVEAWIRASVSGATAPAAAPGSR